MLYNNIMQKQFKSANPQEIRMKLISYMIYMKIHKTILQHHIKMNNPQITKNLILLVQDTLIHHTYQWHGISIYITYSLESTNLD